MILLKTLSLTKLIKQSFILILVMISSAVANNSPAENPLKISAKTAHIDMKNSSAGFTDNIVVNHGNMKITAQSLSQEIDAITKKEKMLLTGNPAEVEFKQKGTQIKFKLEANVISFFSNQGLLIISGNSKLNSTENGQQLTSITADTISIQLTTEIIESIQAKGSPLSYQFSPKQGEPIHASAEELSLNQQTGDVTLLKATVDQGSNKLTAGQIQIDGSTGNLSANTRAEIRPSLSIEFDQETLNKKQQELQEKQP